MTLLSQSDVSPYPAFGRPSVHRKMLGTRRPLSPVELLTSAADTMIVVFDAHQQPVIQCRAAISSDLVVDCLCDGLGGRSHEQHWQVTLGLYTWQMQVSIRWLETQIY